MKNSNKKKKMFLFSKMAILLGFVSPVVLSGVISCSSETPSFDKLPDEETPGSGSDGDKPKPDKPGSGTEGTIKPPAPIKENNSIFKTSSISSFNISQAKIVDRNVSRKLNKDVYQTEITKKYGDKFKYPSWDYNYEGEKGQNKYQIIDGQKIDGTDAVYNERTDYKNSKGEKVKFSDPSFILNEIKNNQLKQHPAAKGWFKENVSDSTKAVNKFFSISSILTGPTALGLYAPAGEVVTLKFKPETLKKMSDQKINDFKVVLNSSYWDNKPAPNSGEISNRYPFVKTEFNVGLEDLKANNGEFKFGSPFGGTISIKVNSKLKSDSSNSFYTSNDNFNFNVIGAVEMLSYIHTVTTQEDWDDQIKRVKSGEISAPAMSLDFAFGSTNLAKTGQNEFAHLALDKMVFPYDALEKWTAFLFISEFFASRDKGNAFKLDFQFCDDIWGGAAAWGGGNTLYSQLSWAANSFLTGASNWTIQRNWGVFHEINHNFQQNGALFKKNTHPETNQVTMVNLSILSDSGRWRNLYNPASDFTTGGWTRFQNLFSTIKHIQNNNYVQNGADENKSEYELQNILLYTLGTFNFLDYVRYDVATNPNSTPGWTGFSEIVELSDYFKLNFWPVLRDFSPWWNDTWPTSDAAATPEQKKEIERLNKSYKAFDFVGNIFASGAYLYNQETNKYDYTNDMQAPLDIADGAPYLFDFEKGINSANKNFSWSKLNFDTKSKLGGTLTLDPKDPNKKKLIYNPPKNATGATDEFNVSITPDNFKGKSNNYVSEYIWKIKVRLVANLPVVSVYNDPTPINNDKNFGENDFNYMKDNNNIAFATTSDPRLGLLHAQDPVSKQNDWQRVKVSFNFVAPEDGNYQFQIKSLSWVVMANRDHPDGKFLWKTTDKAPTDWTNTFNVELKAGQMLPLDIYMTTKWNTTRLELKAIANGKNAYDVFDYALIPWAKDLASDPKKFLGPDYAYQPRTINFNDFQTSLFGLNVSRPQPMIEKTSNDGAVTNYKFVAKQPNDPSIDAKLAKADNNNYEKWSGRNWDGRPYTITFDVDFEKQEEIAALIFYHRNDNWGEARPTLVKITDQDGKTVFDGVYGSQFNDRGSAYSILNLDKIYKVTKLSFELTNEKMISGKESAIILDSVEFSSQRFLNVNRVISMQNPAISFYGDDWKVVNNDPNVNLSAVNGIGLSTAKEKEYLEFDLFAEGFDIIGQKGPDTGEFDVYINGQLVNTVQTLNDATSYNQILYSYNSQVKGGEMLKIKIVNKQNKKIFLNYLQTYGPKVIITKSSK